MGCWWDGGRQGGSGVGRNPGTVLCTATCHTLASSPLHMLVTYVARCTYVSKKRDKAASILSVAVNNGLQTAFSRHGRAAFESYEILVGKRP